MCLLGPRFPARGPIHSPWMGAKSRLCQRVTHQSKYITMAESKTKNSYWKVFKKASKLRNFFFAAYVCLFGDASLPEARFIVPEGGNKDDYGIGLSPLPWNLFPVKMTTAIDHQRNILEIQKPVEALCLTFIYSFLSKNLNSLPWHSPFNWTLV